MFHYRRRRGRSTTVDFWLYDTDGVDMNLTGIHATGDTKVIKDSGADVNTTNGFVRSAGSPEGHVCSLTLTDTEMQAERAVVMVIDAPTKLWLDMGIIVDTFEPPGLLQATDIATLTTQDDFTLAEGSVDNDAYNGMLIVVTDATTLEQKCVGVVFDYVGSTKQVILAYDPGVFTIAAGDYVDILAIPLGLGLAAGTIEFNTAKAGTLTTTEMSTNLGEATADHYIGRTIVWLTGELAKQATDITDYVSTNGVLTFVAITEAPAAGDKFVII